MPDLRGMRPAAALASAIKMLRSEIGQDRRDIVAAAMLLMSEEQAAKLTGEALAIEKARIAVKEDYVSKMSKALSARTGAILSEPIA
jgi:hypothetical protein